MSPTPASTGTERFPKLSVEALAPALAGVVQGAAQRMGYVNDLFLLQGHVPDSVSTFFAYTAAVKAPLSDRFNEVVALTACQELGATAELIQHERLSVRLGLPKPWIAAAEGREGADPAQLTDEEREIQQVVRTVLANGGANSQAALAGLARTLGPAPAMAVLLQTTRFASIAMLCHALDIEVPVPSIFEPETP